MGFPRTVDVTKSLSIEKVVIYIHSKIPGVEEEVLSWKIIRLVLKHIAYEEMHVSRSVLQMKLESLQYTCICK